MRRYAQLDAGEQSKCDQKYCHMKDGQGSVNGGANGVMTLPAVGTIVATTSRWLQLWGMLLFPFWRLTIFGQQPFRIIMTRAYGAANGIPDVLDEAKVATDYFIKSFPDASTFVYYVGNSVTTATG